MRVIISAAGTGGHINPGLAIANKIKEADKKSEIIFIGTTRGLENDLVPKAGYQLKTIEAYGLSKDLKKLYKTFKGIGQAKKIIQEFKPDIIIGTGGYICGPTVIAARKCKVPVLLHESNAFPGKAVQMLAKNTNTICVSFEDAKNRIKQREKVVVTGTPVKIKKKEYSLLQKEEILKKYDINTNYMPIVLIFGGSQGARRINETMIEIISKKMNKNYQIIWATRSKTIWYYKRNFKEE